MAKKKILLIDDEKAFTEMLRLNLESTGGYDVRIENNAKKALLVAMEFRPDLILLDVIMPAKEGPDVFIEIKNEKTLKEIPVVFLTATVTNEEMHDQEGLIGGRQFIAKPCSLETLIHVIEKSITANIFNSDRT